jgi:hypothetical protein
MEHFRLEANRSALMVQGEGMKELLEREIEMEAKNTS